MVAPIIIIIIVAGVSVGATAGYFLVFNDKNPLEVLGNVYPTVNPNELPFDEIEQDPDAVRDEFMEQNPDAVHNPDAEEITPQEFDEIEQNIIDDQADFENPVTSDDNATQQIGDETGSPILPRSGLGLLVEITKTDVNGTKIVEEFTQEFVPLAFFGDPETGIDFSGGNIELRMWIETDPDELLTGDGRFDFNIDQGNVTDSQFSLLSVSGRGDSEGKVTVEFIPITGQKSNVFVFEFDSFQYPIDSRTIFTGTVSDFNVQKDLRDDFTISSSEIFTMDILNSEDALVIQNLDSSISVLFPADDSLKITVSTQTVRTVCCGGIVQYSGTQHPAMGKVEVIDPDGFLIAGHDAIPPNLVFKSSNGRATAGSPVVAVDTLIARDTEYRIVIGSPTPIDFILKTPLSQKNFEFSCVLDEKALGLSLGSMWTGFAYSQFFPENFPTKCNMPLDQVRHFPPIEEGTTSTNSIKFCPDGNPPPPEGCTYDSTTIPSDTGVVSP